MRGASPISDLVSLRFIPLLAVALVACAGPGSTVQLDPLHLEGVTLDGGTEAVVLEPESLFQAGGEAFERGEYQRAFAYYRLLIERFPESPWAGPGQFNAGLSLERLQRWEEALAYFSSAVEGLTDPAEIHDIRLHVATCLEQRQRWDDLVALWDLCLDARGDALDPLEQIEVFARRGWAQRERGHLALAERDFKAAFAVHRTHLSSPGMDRNAHITMARFQVGEIYRELFEDIRFQLPMEQMKRDLEDKSNLFLKAQAAYLRAIRHSHPSWSPQAGFRLGALYETLYEHMMAADIPAELPDEQVSEYFKVLRDRIRPLIEQAVDIFERNIHLTERLGGDDEWLRRSRASLSRLRQVLLEELTRDTLEALHGAP